MGNSPQPCSNSAALFAHLHDNPRSFLKSLEQQHSQEMVYGTLVPRCIHQLSQKLGLGKLIDFVVLVLPKAKQFADRQEWMSLMATVLLKALESEGDELLWELFLALRQHFSDQWIREMVSGRVALLRSFSHKEKRL